MYDVQRGFFLTLWNVYSFFVIYANIDGFDPREHTVAVEQRDAADRWCLSRLNRLIAGLREGLDSFAIMGPARAVEQFIDDLSNWYVRRCRPRFWKPEKDADKWAAYATLYECLDTLCRALAPFTPYLTENLYQNLARTVDPAAPESIHLCDYPAADAALIDDALEAAVEAVRDIVNQGRALRNSAKRGVRRPLALMKIKMPEGDARDAVAALKPMILDELNVRELAFAGDFDDLSAVTLKPNLRTLGKKLGKDIKTLQEKIAADTAGILKSLESNGGYTLETADGPVALEKDDFLFDRAPSSDWAVGDLVALDIRLTEELINAGLAREITHRIQNIRKEMDLDYQRRIRVTIAGDAKLLEVAEQHCEDIAAETLCVELKTGEASGDEMKIDGLALKVDVEPV